VSPGRSPAEQRTGWGPCWLNFVSVLSGLLCAGLFVEGFALLWFASFFWIGSSCCVAPGDRVRRPRGGQRRTGDEGDNAAQQGRAGSAVGQLPRASGAARRAQERPPVLQQGAQQRLLQVRHGLTVSTERSAADACLLGGWVDVSLFGWPRTACGGQRAANVKWAREEGRKLRGMLAYVRRVARKNGPGAKLAAWTKSSPLQKFMNRSCPPFHVWRNTFLMCPFVRDATMASLKSLCIFPGGDHDASDVEDPRCAFRCAESDPLGITAGRPT